MKPIEKARLANRYTRKQLEAALVQAVRAHGHDYKCSAARGLESECHCGWTSIRKMADRISPSAGASDE